MVWFFNHVDTLGRLMKRVTTEQRREEGDEVDEDDDDDIEKVIMYYLFYLFFLFYSNGTKNVTAYASGTNHVYVHAKS